MKGIQIGKEDIKLSLLIVYAEIHIMNLYSFMVGSIMNQKSSSN